MRFERLDLNLIVLFESLLNTENVSRTAAQLHLTQPSVSNALARLRRHFDDDLFVMVGRKLEPTALSLSLKEPVAQFMHLARAIAQKRSTFDPATTERTFSFVASDFVASILMTRVGRRLARQASYVGLRHVQIGTRSVAKFQRGDFDFLIAPDYIEHGTLSKLFLFEEQFVLIACQSNQQVSDQMTLDEFLSHSIVYSSFGDTDQLSAVEDFLSTHGYKQSGRIECENFSLLADFVVGTTFLATIQRSYAEAKARQLPIKIIRPAFELPTIREHLFWHSHLDGEPAARWFMDLIEEEADALRREMAGRAGARPRSRVSE